MAAPSTGRAHPKRQPALNTPDPSYHGAVWVEAVKPLGPVAYIIKARTTLLRDLGSALSPFNAFLILQGIETVALRMERHCENAAGGRRLPGQAARGRARSSTRRSRRARRAGAPTPISRAAMAGWSVSSWRRAARRAARFIDALKLFYHVANIGDARSLAIHPASTTHSQLSAEEQLATGVSDGYVRLSIGIEHIDDILADLSQALDAAGKLKSAA